ncbi:MAG: DUF2934 domain-containing protein [Phycisphaeraceae bacterium]
MHVFTASPKRVAPKSESAMPPIFPAPLHADIARRAYDIYVNKGCQQGQCQQNWQQAEQDLGSKDRS